MRSFPLGVQNERIWETPRPAYVSMFHTVTKINKLKMSQSLIKQTYPVLNPLKPSDYYIYQPL
jgi:hypothetical protein